MKKMFFGSTLATLLAAGSTLMMAAAPVAAATDDTSEATVRITTDDETDPSAQVLSLDSVPGFDFGPHHASELPGGIGGEGKESITHGTQPLTVSDTRTKDNSTTWTLMASKTPFTLDGRSMGGSTIAISATGTIPDGYSKIDGTIDSAASSVAQGTGDVAGSMTAEGVEGELTQDPYTGKVNNGDTFTSVITWNLSATTGTISGL